MAHHGDAAVPLVLSFLVTFESLCDLFSYMQLLRRSYDNMLVLLLSHELV